jgi:hypothetical protein
MAEPTVAEALVATLGELQRAQAERAKLDERIADLTTQASSFRMFLQEHDQTEEPIDREDFKPISPIVGMRRTDAVEFVLKSTREPLTPTTVMEILHLNGRADDYHSVSASLLYLQRRDRAHRVARGLWLAGVAHGDDFDPFVGEDEPETEEPF